MSFFTLLWAIIIGPLKLLFEIIFKISLLVLEDPGLSIIAMSLIVNILVLPLYKRADIMQEQARNTEAKLRDGVTHIKKTFKGNKRMMLIQTYYRQNNYKPISSLRGMTSLLLQIPFFMAAYQFLSGLVSLKGVSFGPIHDLSLPDGLLAIGTLSVNVLPVIMTLVNLISCAIYLKGFPVKNKLQMYGMAFIFLILLYGSPAGLTFYWTLNNIFSLGKNIVLKTKNPAKVAACLAFSCGICELAASVVYIINNYSRPGMIKRYVALLAVGIMLCLPVTLRLIKKVNILKNNTVHSNGGSQPFRPLFIGGSVFLTLLTGALIPSTYIADSPQEYVSIKTFFHPNWYVVYTFCIAAGIFLVWFQVFYWLADSKHKALFDKLIVIGAGVGFVDYMFFGLNLGLISSKLKYENGISFTMRETIINILVLSVVCAVLYIVAGKWKRVTAFLLIAATLTQFGLSAANMVTIKRSIDKLKIEDTEQDSELPHFNLSKNGKNVIVIMLDRFMSGYVPFILNEKPELKEQLSGFTFYENTISFGRFTIYGVPTLYGGYEYTPVEMNKRDNETMVSKHNEALKMLPTLFSENDYEVTVCDPPYANYSWITDISIFDDSPDITAYATKKIFHTIEGDQIAIDSRLRNFICFGIMKSSPLFLQNHLYNHGDYYQISSESSGELDTFLESFNALYNLPSMTNINSDTSNTFIIMCNNTPHNLVLLQEPEYLPQQNIDNTEYDRLNTERFTVDGNKLLVSSDNEMAQYHDDMAALLQIGKWMDYLRENDVYDNTRIILVADHGSDYFQLENSENTTSKYSRLFPLLMVKDFNSKEFTVSDEFMTNADVASIAVGGLIDNPVNPFTGKEINNNEKYAHGQLIINSSQFFKAGVDEYTFKPSTWINVNDNALDLKNWTESDKETVLKEYRLP